MEHPFVYLSNEKQSRNGKINWKQYVKQRYYRYLRFTFQQHQ